jgi:hypothetical protein
MSHKPKINRKRLNKASNQTCLKKAATQNRPRNLIIGCQETRLKSNWPVSHKCGKSPNVNRNKSNSTRAARSRSSKLSTNG